MRSFNRAALHRFRVLLNPLVWTIGGAAPEHRAEFLNAADLAARELDEPDPGGQKDAGDGKR